MTKNKECLFGLKPLRFRKEMSTLNVDCFGAALHKKCNVSTETKPK